jgi:hypothetical protein
LASVVQKESTLVELQFSTKPPKAKVPRALLHISVEQLTVGCPHLHPLEVARQMTLLDHRLYRGIKPEECLHMRWTKDDKDDLAPNVLASIRQFCNVGLWAVYEIVRENDIEKRAQVLFKLIQIAYENLKLNNFNGSMASMFSFLIICTRRMIHSFININR